MRKKIVSLAPCGRRSWDRGLADRKRNASGEQFESFGDLGEELFGDVDLTDEALAARGVVQGQDLVGDFEQRKIAEIRFWGVTNSDTRLGTSAGFLSSETQFLSAARVFWFRLGRGFSLASFRCRSAEREPGPEFIQRRTKIRSPFRKRVLDPRRHFGMNLPRDEPVPLELTQLLDKHLLAHGGYRAFQIGETQYRVGVEVEEYPKFPSAFDGLQRILRHTRCIVDRGR